MKTIIAGSRSLTHAESVKRFLDSTKAEMLDITEVVSGGARGIDAIGEEWAKERGIPLKVFPADWKAHGKAAGPIRNRAMAEYADALIAIWDGRSPGTRNMIAEAHKRDLTVIELELEMPTQNATRKT